jgi:glycosyltransferase involved in cell wall biosynthesis
MIVKNESHVIEECLQSVAHLVYYVINDTGSTDDTREKIKAFFDARGIKGEIIDHKFRTSHRVDKKGLKAQLQHCTWCM